jgi:hypothetical protein
VDETVTTATDTATQSTTEAPPSTDTATQSTVISDLHTIESTQQYATQHQERIPEKGYASVVKRQKASNITPQNICEILLCQIPSIGPETAAAISAKYPHIKNLIRALETDGTQCLTGISTTDSQGQSRKISKKCVENIMAFLVSSPTPLPSNISTTPEQISTA